METKTKNLKKKNSFGLNIKIYYLTEKNRKSKKIGIGKKMFFFFKFIKNNIENIYSLRIFFSFSSL